MAANLEMREIYTNTLIELAQENPNVVVLEADLMKAHGTGKFKQAFPDRTFDVGVAEANMISTAAGLSAMGKIPFAATFGCFASRRCFDQFFISANYARLNVKLVGSDPGITAALNGGTHMPFEDVGLMRVIPGVVIFEPSDPVSLTKLMRRAALYEGSCYMRLHRKAVPALYAESEEFELGKGKVLFDGSDVTLIASGAVMVAAAAEARKLLAAESVSAAVIDMHTIKPIDSELVLKYARATGAIVTCENHQITNGLGSAVAEVLAENCPTLMRRVGAADEFGEVGDVAYLQNRFGMTPAHIVEKVRSLLAAKTGRVAPGSGQS